MSFAKDIEAWAKKVQLAAEDVPAVVCLTLSTSIIERSPVDTGRFRGNWQATIASPASGETSDTDKTGATAIARAGSVSQKASGSLYYLVNNLPYARRLEYGYSQQAPGGMVRVSVQEFHQAVSDAVRKVRK